MVSIGICSMNQRNVYSISFLDIASSWVVRYHANLKQDSAYIRDVCRLYVRKVSIKKWYSYWKTMQIVEYIMAISTNANHTVVINVPSV